MSITLGGGSGSLGSLTPQLGLGLGLDGEVGLLDGGNAGDGSLAEVRAVAVLRGLVGNSLVAALRTMVCQQRPESRAGGRGRERLTCG